MNLAAAFRSNVRRRPGAPALRTVDGDLSYAALDASSNAVARYLRSVGIEPGDRVAIQMPNRTEFVETVLGAVKAGAVVVPVSYLDGPDQLRHILTDSQASLLVYDASLRNTATPVIEELALPALFAGAGSELPGLPFRSAVDAAPAGTIEPPGTGDDLFYIGYTSGSTGRPKGVVRTHASVTRMAYAVALELGLRPGWTQLVTMPMCHSGALWQLVFNLMLGGAAGILPRPGFDADCALELIDRWQAQWSVLVPTMSDALLAAPNRDAGRDSLRVLLSGSAPMFSSTKQGLLERFPNAALNECYGATESGVVSNLAPADQLRKERCVGLPLLGVELRLDAGDGSEPETGEIGEVLVRSPYTFLRYHNLPERTAEARRDDGFIGVGDLGRFDDEGYLYIVDRKNDMIISGGLNVYPAEVEEVLKRQPAVRDAVVVGVTDERWGERVCAAVIAEGPCDEVQLQAACQQALAAYKIPKTIRFVDELPQLVSGKNARRLVRDLLSEEGS